MISQITFPDLLHAGLMSLRSLQSRPVNRSFLCFAGKKVCYARENKRRTGPIVDGEERSMIFM